MKRVELDQQWTLFCPTVSTLLYESHGTDFETHYCHLEKQQLPLSTTIQARTLWKAIVTSQIETGTPYLLYKDACNYKSNQKHLGTIKSSNLCAEIIQYSNEYETAVCNLASLALPQFIVNDEFDFTLLEQKTAILVRNINKIIDLNYYPTPCAKISNLKHRPMGIGVQGLADVFQKLNMPFGSNRSRLLNQNIFETIYFAALQESNRLAEEHHYDFPVTLPFRPKGAHASFEGSPLSMGQFQFDLWGVQPSQRYPWDDLRRKIQKYGVRNSLLISLMPTASTSQILGNNETTEPFTSNLYIRRVLSGEFVCVNKHLVHKLSQLNLWTPELRNLLIQNRGSIQNIPNIPNEIKKLFRTVWEIPQKSLIDLAADRAPFICQSQSLNLFLSKPSYSKVSAMHFYAFRKGLKTGIYYLRTKPATNAIQFSVVCQDKDKKRKIECLSCGS